MAKTAKKPDKGEKQVDRLLLLLRMIPRRGRISTTEIQGRLKAEHNITHGDCRKYHVSHSDQR
jgi:hypothetical protein